MVVAVAAVLGLVVAVRSRTERPIVLLANWVHHLASSVGGTGCCSSPAPADGEQSANEVHLAPIGFPWLGKMYGRRSLNPVLKI